MGSSHARRSPKLPQSSRCSNPISWTASVYVYVVAFVSLSLCLFVGLSPVCHNGRWFPFAIIVSDAIPPSLLRVDDNIHSVNYHDVKHVVHESLRRTSDRLHPITYIYIHTHTHSEILLLPESLGSRQTRRTFSSLFVLPESCDQITPDDECNSTRTRSSSKAPDQLPGKLRQRSPPHLQ